MKRPVLAGLGVIASAVAAAGMFGGGVAAAGSDFSGWTYKEASQHITGQKLTPVIASIVGGQLATNDCMVTSSKARGLDVLLNLNCNLALAEPGKPGNSLASPEGRQAKSELTTIDYMNRNPEQACPDEKSIVWCTNECSKWAGKCSSELENYLGMS